MPNLTEGESGKMVLKAVKQLKIGISKISEFCILLQLIQNISIWYYQKYKSRKSFLQNSMINMRLVAMTTLASLHHQFPYYK